MTMDRFLRLGEKPMKNAMRLGCCVAALGLLANCAAVQSPGWRSAPIVAAQSEDAIGGVRRSATVLGALALYLPNRLLDLGDVVTVGVNVGPGFGVGGQATKAASAVASSDTSVGVGFQTFRRLPVCARSRTLVAVGPVRAPSLSPLGWRTRFWDVGGELHVALLGAHAYVNPDAILDAAAGFFFFDPSEDDFVLGI